MNAPRGTSTLLLGASLIAILSIPIALLPTSLAWDGSWVGFARRVVGIVLPVLAFVAYGVTSLVRGARAQRHLARLPLLDEQRINALPPAVVATLRKRVIEIRVLGAIPEVPPAASPLEGPRLVRSLRSAWPPRWGHGIEIPGATAAQIERASELVGGAIAHEIGHVENRDTEWLLELAALTRWLQGSALVYLTLSVATSAWVDSEGRWSTAPWIAAIVGKAYFVAIAIYLLLLGVLVRRSRAVREWLADESASKLVGPEMIARAIAAMRAHAPGYARPTAFSDALDAAVAGLALQSGLNFAFGWLNFVVPAPRPLLVDLLVSAYAYGLFTGIGTVALVAVTREDRRARAPVFVAAFLGGAAVSHFVLDILPLLATSTLMPDGYDFVFKHDPVALVIWGSVANVLATVAVALGPALLATLPHRRAATWLGAAAALIVPVICTIEARFWSAGWGVAGTAASLGVVALGIALHAARGPGLQMRSVGLAVAAGAAYLAYLAGEGDVTHAAACVSTDVEEAVARGDVIGCRRASAFSTWIGRHHDEAWTGAARCEIAASDLRAAAHFVDSAVDARNTSDLTRRFRSLVHAGDLYLQLRADRTDIQSAVDRYRAAHDIFRQCSRVDVPEHSFYNAACAIALDTGECSPEVLAHLVEAVSLVPALARQTLSDPDLAACDLTRSLALDRSRLPIITQDPTVPGVLHALAVGALSTDDLRATIQLLARSSPVGSR